jgi:hypothetical protein
MWPPVADDGVADGPDPLLRANKGHVQVIGHRCDQVKHSITLSVLFYLMNNK